MYDQKLKDKYKQAKDNETNPWSLQGRKQTDRNALFSKPLLPDVDD